MKLIPCFRTFREAFRHPYISFFHLLVNGFSAIINKVNYNDSCMYKYSVDIIIFIVYDKVYAEVVYM